METIDKNHKEPKMYGLVTHQSLDQILYTNRISKFLSGSIFGTDAAMITVFRKSKIPTLILYTECHPFFPDPEASIIAITTLSKMDLQLSYNCFKLVPKWCQMVPNGPPPIPIPSVSRSLLPGANKLEQILF